MQPLLQKMFRNASHSLPMDTSREMSPFVSRLVNSCLLYSVHQTRPHSDAAAVGLSKVSKDIQSGLCLSFCCKFFHESVSSKSSNSCRFLKIKRDSFCTDPFPSLESSDIDGCNGNKVSWYPVSSNPSLTYMKTADSLWICCTEIY